MDNRQRLLLLVALPIIAGSVFLLWKEYGEYYGKSPTADISQMAELPSLPFAKPAKADNTRADRGLAKETTPRPRSAEQATVIARAKNTAASSLDSSLPNQPISEWMQRAAGSSATILWETNDCGEAARQSGSVPLCAQANINFSDGTKFQALVLIGTRATKSHDLEFADASLMWAAYAKPSSGDFTPAPLSSLQRVALEAR